MTKNIIELNIPHMTPADDVIKAIKSAKKTLSDKGFTKISFYTSVNGAGFVSYYLKGIK